MDMLLRIFGEGKDLSTSQMACRTIVVFIIILLLVRLSGRRSFGIKTPLDNIVAISLGALLSRAIVGASPFLPVVASGFVLVLLHRLLAYCLVNNKGFKTLIDGDKILLFQNGSFIEKNMKKAMVCKEDIMQGVRKSALTDDLSKIDRIFMEPNGEISALKKKAD